MGEVRTDDGRRQGACCRRNEGRGAGNISALRTLALGAGRADAVVHAGIGFILIGPYGGLRGIDHLQGPDSPLLQFPPHDPGQGVVLRRVKVADPKLRRVHAVAAAHDGDDRRSCLLALHYYINLCRHGIQRIDDVVKLRPGEFSSILGQVESLVLMDHCIGIQIVDPLLRHIHLVMAYCGPGGKHLPV